MHAGLEIRYEANGAMHIAAEGKDDLSRECGGGGLDVLAKLVAAQLHHWQLRIMVNGGTVGETPRRRLD